MKKILVLALATLMSTSVMAAKDDRFKKSELDAETVLAALQDGAVKSFGKTKFSRIIPQSITVSGVHQVEDSQEATVYLSFVPKGSESAIFSTITLLRFNSDYWYFPSSNKFLKK